MPKTSNLITTYFFPSNCATLEEILEAHRFFPNTPLSQLEIRSKTLGRGDSPIQCLMLVAADNKEKTNN